MPTSPRCLPWRRRSSGVVGYAVGDVGFRAVLRAARAVFRPVLRVARATFRPVLRAARAVFRPVVRVARATFRPVLRVARATFRPVLKLKTLTRRGSKRGSSMSSISYIDEVANCATRVMSSCVLLSDHVIWHDWGTLRFVPLPSGENASCRSTQFPKISRSLERVRRLIGFYSQEPQRDMPSNGAISRSSKHKRS
jgi:hypothetical protein